MYRERDIDIEREMYNMYIYIYIWRRLRFEQIHADPGREAVGRLGQGGHPACVRYSDITTYVYTNIYVYIYIYICEQKNASRYLSMTATPAS